MKIANLYRMKCSLVTEEPSAKRSSACGSYTAPSVDVAQSVVVWTNAKQNDFGDFDSNQSNVGGTLADKSRLPERRVVLLLAVKEDDVSCT